MSNISDVIEQFIIESLGDDSILNLSRNDLAGYFSCAPSQINYVLSTRFTPTRGYLIESRRGGGGFVKLMKLNLTSNRNLLENLRPYLRDELSFKDGCYILEMLCRYKILSESEKDMAIILISNKSIANPFRLHDKIRSNMIKELIYFYIKEK